MKIISKLFLLIFGVLLASCDGTSKFDKNAYVAFERSEYLMYQCAQIAQDYEAIWNTIDFNVEYGANGVKLRGPNMNDMNLPMDLQIKKQTLKNSASSLNMPYIRVMDLIKEMENPPSSRKDCYNDLVEIFVPLSQAYKYIDNPSECSTDYYNFSKTELDLLVSVKNKLEAFKIKYSSMIEEQKKATSANPQ